MKDQIPESPLLERARKGDMEAFAALFEPLRQQALTVAARLTGPDDAPDVVMDAFLKAWKALPGFDGRSRLSTWLHRIVWNCAADRLRAGKRRREVALPRGEDGQELDLPDPAADSPAERVGRRDLAEQLDTALGSLPDALRASLLLRYADGFSYREIAAATGVRIGTVMSRLFHGRRRLKQLMVRIENGESP